MDRQQALDRLGEDTFDVLVVGGGVIGTGVALDAAARGLRTALVEKQDFGAGTSSKSTKLLHGGLRYLQHLEFGLVREGLRERGVLQRLAPHLVTPLPFVVPRYGKRRLIPFRAALEAYDVLAIGSGFPRHHRAGPEEVLRLAPALRPDIAGGLVYWDARTDDTRLTWTIARTAAEHGAVLANYAEATGLLRSGPVIGDERSGRVSGARVRDLESGAEVEARARVVINATGVWSDEVRRLEHPAGGMGIRPSKGVHLVFDTSKIELSSALCVPAPDGRYVFVVPWEEGRVLVGTTDDDYGGALDEPRTRGGDVDYLLRTVNRVLAQPLDRTDVVATFAGLRPLVQRPGQPSKDLSRKHKVLVGPSRLVTILGGKLTGYRPIAADAVDAALEAGSFKRRPSSPTLEIPLAGAAGQGAEEELGAVGRRAGLEPAQGARLYHRYGSLAREVIHMLEAEPALSGPLHPELPYLRAEAAYAVASEQALRPDDVLGRRLRVRILSRDRGVAALDWVADRLAGRLGWPAERREREVEAYRSDVAADLASESLPGC